MAVRRSGWKVLQSGSRPTEGQQLSSSYWPVRKLRSVALSFLQFLSSSVVVGGVVSAILIHFPTRDNSSSYCVLQIDSCFVFNSSLLIIPPLDARGCQLDFSAQQRPERERNLHWLMLITY